MKIAYFSYLWDLWGMSIGSTIKGLELMRGLRDLGHDVSEYWLRDDIERKAVIDENTKEVRHLFKKYLKNSVHEPSQLLKNVMSYQKELRLLQQTRPDMVISRTACYVDTPGKLMKKTDIPFVIELDSPSVYEKLNFQSFRVNQYLLQKMERRFILGGRTAFTVSNRLKSHFVNQGIPEDHLHVIPNGADPDRFKPDIDCEAIKTKYQLHNALVIGFVGSFVYWHGVDNLMQVIQNTLKEFKEVKFFMVGDGGGMKGDLERFLEETGLSERAVLTGFVPHEEVPQYMAAMDITLAPYPDLDFFYYSPVKMYEYMSCGKAMVSSRIGQIAEVIEHGKNGMLAPPDDIDAFQKALFDLIEDERLRQTVGARARADVLAKHTWKKRSEALAQLCNQYL